MAKSQSTEMTKQDQATENAIATYNPADAGWIRQLDKSAYEGIVVERVHSLQEKQVIEGELLGRGQTLETEKMDPRTGEVEERAIHTHRIKVTSKLTVAILESYALRAMRALPIGTRVRLIHQGFIRKGSRQIADVIVATLGNPPDGAKPDPRWSEVAKPDPRRSEVAVRAS
jgi:hypothetical protein